ncbi:MAG: 1-deoxy-D-xylulose-5-phosphate reductoisomerase [Nanoarchaeota archaeon]
MKSISILGSTGSIGRQTLEVVRGHNKEFRVVGLTTNTNIELIKKQIEEFKPLSVCVMDEEKADLLRTQIDIEVFSGLEGLKKIAILESADTVVNSLVGSIGILPTISAIKSKKSIAIANKETLVTAGKIVMSEVKKQNVSFIPIDSEHSAMWQCLQGNRLEDVRKIVLTCSGGPFRRLSNEQLIGVSVNDALQHPTWDMGAKITIDSATLMNKGFEVIETHWLYGLDYDNIEVVIHPESIIHSMVEFSDNSIIAQLSLPDMRLPIQYALSYPRRIENGSVSLDLSKIRALTFENPDLDRFPCLRFAYFSGKSGGSLPTVLNATNEVAVRCFLDKKIKFSDIPKIIKEILDSHKTINNPELDDIIEIDKKVKLTTEDFIINNLSQKNGAIYNQI